MVDPNEQQESKSDVWYITCLRESVLKAVFDEPVTQEEAMELFLDGSEEDIIDEYDTGVFTIINVSQTS